MPLVRREKKFKSVKIIKRGSWFDFVKNKGAPPCARMGKKNPDPGLAWIGGFEKKLF